MNPSADEENQDAPAHDHPRVGPHNLDLDAVGRVAARIELRDVRLLWAHAALNCEPADVPAGWSSQALLGYDVHVPETAVADRARATLLFFAHYDMSWDAMEEEPRPSADPEDPDDIEIAVSFVVDYDVLDEMEPSDFDHFAFYNARFNAWPYWREYAHSTTTRMGVAPLIVPVFRVQKLQADEATAHEADGPSPSDSEQSSSGEVPS